MTADAKTVTVTVIQLIHPNFKTVTVTVIFFRNESSGITRLPVIILTRTVNPTPATCHKRKRKLRCSFRNAALKKLHCNIRFSAVRKLFVPKVALQQAKTALQHRKAALQESGAFLPLSCGFQAPTFRHPRLGPAESSFKVIPRVLEFEGTLAHLLCEIFKAIFSPSFSGIFPRPSGYFSQCSPDFSSF